MTAATDDSVADVITGGEPKLLLLLSMLIFGRQRGLGACDRDDLVINILTRGRDFASATAIQYS